MSPTQDEISDWYLHPDHWAICRNASFWKSMNNSQCHSGKVPCNGNLYPGFCTPNRTWEEGKEKYKYWVRLKGSYRVARIFFLLLLNCSAWPFLGPA